MNNSEISFDLDLVSRYGGRGPRYTSYPTAIQFDESYTATHYAANAASSNTAGLPLSLYVHVPFCDTLCYYCACNKIVTRNAARVTNYLQCLHREIELQAELFDDQRLVEQLHFGGGTPTYLDEAQLAKLLSRLRSAFCFDGSDDREFSIEVDPRTVDKDRISELAELGFNRLSLGIQDFDPKVQAAVNRQQSADDVLMLMIDARHVGFKSISFDLIYGLPHQSPDSFDQTLELVIGMQPDRLAVYNYAHLPNRFKGQRMINAADIPLPETKLEILRHTIEQLLDAGYEYVGMDHFALPGDDLVEAKNDGTLQRNFQGYSTHRQCDLVGLGVSAISSVGTEYAQNAHTTADYEAMIRAGNLAIRKGIAVDRDDRIRAAVIQSLMCYDSVRFSDINSRYNIDFRRYFESELERLLPLVADDLVHVTPDGIYVRPKGRLLLRSIAMLFDRYIEQSSNNTRYSKTV